MSLLKPAKFFLGLSTALVATSIALCIAPGPKLSIDFTGGTLMEVRVSEETTKERVQETLNSYESDPALGNVAITMTKDGTAMLRMRDISNEEHLALLKHMRGDLGQLKELQFTTIGPTVGASLKKRSFWALTLAAVAIVLYIAFVFRKIPRKLSPWRFGIIAVITLLHDVLITVGIFVIISHTTTFEFDTLFITALLTILGYSVNDTIVIFDRIRDNLAEQGRKEDFVAVANRSLNDSITRSINTSASTLIMLCSLFILGSESIRWFVLTLMVGAIVGTYSSLFLATPLLVYWKKKA